MLLYLNSVRYNPDLDRLFEGFFFPQPYYFLAFKILFSEIYRQEHKTLRVCVCVCVFKHHHDCH